MGNTRRSTGAASKNEGNLFGRPVGLGPSKLHSMSVKSRRCFTTTSQPISIPLTTTSSCPDKCLKIKLQKYFNILWQHADIPHSHPHPHPHSHPLTSAQSGHTHIQNHRCSASVVAVWLVSGSSSRNSTCTKQSLCVRNFHILCTS